MAGASTQQPVPRCPRCGYDQSGLIATWTESCPLAALCTECGYSFDPADAIHPTRKRLPWLYEHAKHWWSVRAWWRTVLMLLWPPLFWKRVRPEHEVRVGRLVMMTLLPVVAVLTSLVVLNLAEHLTAGRTYYYRQTTLAPWGTSITDGFQEFASGFMRPAFREWLWTFSNTDISLFFIGVFWLPPSLAFLAVSSEWAKTKLTRKHLARVLLYAIPPLLVPMWVMTIWQQGIQWYQIVYMLQPPQGRLGWPEPWRIDGIDLSSPAIFALTLVWLPLYWFCAIRYGYTLPSTKRPFLVVLSVLLTPWTLFLAFQGYYAFIA
jgi:hypothetical protein